jgi:hypothetical protein
MNSIEAILNQLKEALREELRGEVRQEIIAELSGGKTSKAVKPISKPGPKPKAASPAALKVKKGVKRTAEDIEQAGRVISLWLRSNPGSRVDQMSKALQVPVKDLQLPLSVLVGSKKVKKAGKLRGTTYALRG